MSIKEIKTGGITHIEPLDGSPCWYWGTDYTHGDLYEAEELFKLSHPVMSNKLVFVRYPEGEVIQPVVGKEGQYFGRPIYCNGHITMLLVDFPAEQIRILQYDEGRKSTEVLQTILLTEVDDCYNLMLKTSPLMLTRHGHEDRFQIVWPEKVVFSVGERESFWFRDGDKLYFSAWQEDPEYREEVIVRMIGTGEVLMHTSGSPMIMPDGQLWVLK